MGTDGQTFLEATRRSRLRAPDHGSKLRGPGAHAAADRSRDDACWALAFYPCATALPVAAALYWYRHRRLMPGLGLYLGGISWCSPGISA